MSATFSNTDQEEKTEKLRSERETQRDSSSDATEDLVWELLGVEQGFWKTFKALTARPGTALRQYLHGNRAVLVGPISYLGAALAARGIIAAAFGFVPYSTDSAENSVPEFENLRSATQQALGSDPIQLVFVAVTVFLAGAALSRFLGQKLEKGSDALALSSYLTAQSVLISTALGTASGLLYFFVPSGASATASMKTVAMMGIIAVALGLVLTVGVLLYFWVALYGSFGRNWWDATKGTVGFVVGSFEGGMAVAGLQSLYALILTLYDPDTYVGMDIEGLQSGLYFAFVIVLLVPVLLHFVVEIRYWRE